VATVETSSKLEKSRAPRGWGRDVSMKFMETLLYFVSRI